MIDNIRSTLVLRNELYRAFFDRNHSEQLLRCDHGLRCLLDLSVKRPTTHEQDEAQLGIIALLLQNSGTSNVMSLSHYNEAATAIARSIENGPAGQISDSLAVSMALLAYYDVRKQLRRFPCPLANEMCIAIPTRREWEQSSSYIHLSTRPSITTHVFRRILNDS